MAKRSKRVLSTLTCPVCSLKLEIPRRVSQKRKERHLKNIYCIRCGKVQKFVENNYYTMYESEVNA